MVVVVIVAVLAVVISVVITLVAVVLILVILVVITVVVADSCTISSSISSNSTSISRSSKLFCRVYEVTMLWLPWNRSTATGPRSQCAYKYINMFNMTEYAYASIKCVKDRWRKRDRETQCQKRAILAFK